MLKNILIILLFATAAAMPVNYGRVFKDMGYTPEDNPVEIVEVHIPMEWDGVYVNYNRLQKSGGFDLEPYKGKTCTRYTYSIPEYFARGNVLVYDGKVIGGDICSITIDGIMLPLEKEKIK